MNGFDEQTRGIVNRDSTDKRVRSFKLCTYRRKLLAMLRKPISFLLTALISAGAFHISQAASSKKTFTQIREEFTQATLFRFGESFSKARALPVKPKITQRHPASEWQVEEQSRSIERVDGFADAEREGAIERGMRFVYRTARSPANFADYGSDYVWWFAAISNTVRDERLRQMARDMAIACARRWLLTHRALPKDADADTIIDFVSGLDAIESLGLRDDQLKEEIRRAALRFTARDFLGFDPKGEPPPADVPDECKYDGANDNPRGAKFCHVCKRRLAMRTRYDVWYDALVTTHMGDHYGITLGAHYADVLRWLPALAPYRAKGRGTDVEFIDAVYSITHLVYTLNDFWTYRLDTQLLPQEHEFLKASLPKALAARDADMIGEIMDSLKSFGLDDSDPLINKGTLFLLAHQNRDGSWGDVHNNDVYERYHATETAINGLCEYTLRDERLSFPEVEPMLKRWARESTSLRN